MRAVYEDHVEWNVLYICRGRSRPVIEAIERSATRNHPCIIERAHSLCSPRYPTVIRSWDSCAPEDLVVQL